MTAKLFDGKLRALRRDRAYRTGPELFLHHRAFDDILERVALVNRRFTRALLIGCPDPSWPQALLSSADAVQVLDPGPLFAAAAEGIACEESRLPVIPGSADLCVAMGTLDTVNDLPAALLNMRFALAPDSLLIGAVAGGETLPRLRAAMRAADEVTGEAVPHVHPRIDAAALCGLLTAAGFSDAVVDVDRVDVAYRSMRKLIGDLRAMAATNILEARPRRPLTCAALNAATAAFEGHDAAEAAVERFEILHFAAWTPAQQ